MLDGCFIYFLHEIVVNWHFHIFNMASKKAAKGHVTITICTTSSGAHTNFLCNYFENCTMNFVEKYMVLKLKCCMMYWNLFNFINQLFILFILLLTLSVYMILCLLQGISGYQQIKTVFPNLA